MTSFNANQKSINNTQSYYFIFYCVLNPTAIMDSLYNSIKGRLLSVLNLSKSTTSTLTNATEVPIFSIRNIVASGYASLASTTLESLLPRNQQAINEKRKK
jgi:hypothetical protein